MAALVVALWVLAASQAVAQPLAVAPLGPDDPESWAANQIASGKPADFDLRCHPDGAVRAPDPCRAIAIDVVRTAVLQTGAAAPRRVDIQHAFIVGDLDLADADLKSEVSIEHSLIVGDVDLSRARFASRLSLRDTKVTGLLDASGLRVGEDVLFQDAVLSELRLNEAVVDGPLSLSGATIAKQVEMPNAKIGVDLNLSGATLNGVDATGMHVGGRIYAFNQQTGGPLRLADVSTGGDILLSGVLGEVNLNSAHIGSTLHMDHFDDSDRKVPVIFQREVDLDGAQIEDDWSVDHADFQQGLRGQSMHVKQDLELTGAHFGASFDLQGARIDGSLIATGTTWAAPVDMRLLTVAQDLDLQAATLVRLDLSGATIAGMFRLGAGAARPCWSVPVRSARTTPCVAAPYSMLSLRNARAGAVEGELLAWPRRLDLSAFTYAHIHVPAPPGQDTDPSAAWRSWLERNAPYSPQHYLQLANVLASDGDRDNSFAVQFASRNEERKNACHAAWQDKSIPDGLTCGLLTLMWAAGGYGIGNYTWFALIWIFLFVGIGTAVVLRVRWSESRNVFWAAGASVEKLLPYVKLDRSFTDFYDRKDLLLWHKLIFGFLALIGSVLGLFLAAAVSGLTQKG